MKNVSKIIVCASMLAVSIASSAAVNSFYQVGKKYLFIPRVEAVELGTVVQVTPQEVVFKDRYVLKHSLIKNAKKHQAKATKAHNSAVKEFLNSKNRKSLLVPAGSGDVAVSYPRAALAGILVK